MQQGSGKIISKPCERILIIPLFKIIFPAEDEDQPTGYKLWFVHGGVFDVQNLLAIMHILFLPNHKTLLTLSKKPYSFS